jgi:hypothetical protein
MKREKIIMLPVFSSEPNCKVPINACAVESVEPTSEGGSLVTMFDGEDYACTLPATQAWNLILDAATKP